MIKKLAFGEGVQGVVVEISNVDLVAIKSFIKRASKYVDGSGKSSLYGEPKELMTNAVNFFNSILPAEIMSVEDAYKQLFEIPEEEKPADNVL